MRQAAHILGNAAGETAARVRRRFDGLVAAMARHRGRAGGLAEAVDHFRKVARSHRPGLFHCYAVPGLPRTNNGLEQLFGAQRHHERRATGRKTASPATVLRGE
ncbi:MAG: ISNCY family transposase, partial [Acetobacteraceae bacterium]|nr:ISNCY family transposase [Acetobacteraceae bacterium]